jgi:hypothetical protein
MAHTPAKKESLIFAPGALGDLRQPVAAVIGIIPDWPPFAQHQTQPPFLKLRKVTPTSFVMTPTEINIFDHKTRVGEVQANHVTNEMVAMKGPDAFGNFAKGKQF